MNFIPNFILFLCARSILFCEAINSIKRTRDLRPRPVPRSYDECNPLYWDPRHRPKYCERIKKVSLMENLIIPSPPLPIPQSPFLPPPFPSPMPFDPLPYMPYGTYRHHMSSYSSAYQPQAGMVPGLPGIVSEDGGINIMPFSDVYADMLEKHKNKMVRRKLQRIIDKYEYPNWKYKRYLRDYDY